MYLEYILGPCILVFNFQSFEIFKISKLLDALLRIITYLDKNCQLYMVDDGVDQCYLQFALP
jgi:hypothetical protein